MSFCTTCGNKLAPEARFCNSCGKEHILSSKSCSQCGRQLQENEKFCPGCGTSNQQQNKEKQKESDKNEKYTKEGRKIISGGPRTSHHSPPSPPTLKKKKKKGCLGCLGKSLLIITVLIVAGIIILWNLPDENSDSLKHTISSSPDNADIPEKKPQTMGKNKIKVNDPNGADKFKYGIDVISDQYEAVKRYEKLVRKGDPNAMIQLSEYYRNGIWVKKDISKANKLLKQAADKGSVNAQWQLEFLESKSKK